MNKKGITWEQLVLAIIAVIVVVLVILWFRSGGEKGFKFTEEKIGQLGTDGDSDGVADIIDQCAGGEKGKVDAQGCPLPEEPTEQKTIGEITAERKDEKSS